MSAGGLSPSGGSAGGPRKGRLTGRGLVGGGRTGWSGLAYEAGGCGR